MAIEAIIGAVVTLLSAVATAPWWGPFFSTDRTQTIELLKNKKQNLWHHIKEIKQKRGELGVFTKQVSDLIKESEASFPELDESVIVNLEGRIAKRCMHKLLPDHCTQNKAQSKILEELIPKLNNLIQQAESINKYQKNPCRGHKQSREVDIQGQMRNQTKDKIWELISSAAKPNVICIHGALGVGKTAMAKSIQNKALNEEYENMFAHVLWVEVEYGADVWKVQECIAKSLKIEYNCDTIEERGKKLEEALLEMDSFLLVLDSVWKPMSLREIGIPELKDRRKLIITSRISSVCQQMGEMPRKFEIQPLDQKEEDWKLFEKEMEGATPIWKENTEIISIIRALLAELDGLPMAISKFALTLGNRQDEQQRIEHKEFLSDLAKELLNQFNPSYKNLDEKARHCFLYCALFPKGHVISAKELIEYWMWEGLLGEDYGSLKEGTIAGRKTLRDLQNAHLLQLTGDEGVRMRNVFRTVAIEIMATEGKVVCIQSGSELTSLPPGGRDWNPMVERASFMKNKIRALDLTDSINYSQLLTLLLQDNPLDWKCNKDFFRSMSNLKVVDLSRTTIGILPISLSNLIQLRALILRSCSKLRNLPDLSKLQQLIVLDVSSTPLEKCPEGIQKIRSLRRLNLSRTRIAAFPANVVGQLIALEELLMITDRDCVWGSTQNEGKGLCIDDLLKLKKLAVLELHFLDAEALKKYVNNSTNVPSEFRYLVGGGYVEENYSPNHSMVSLNVLDVSNLNDVQYLFPAAILKHLIMLKELRVRNCKEILDIVQREQEPRTDDAERPIFRELTRIVLFDLPRIESVWCGKVLICPNLRAIEVRDCPNLKLPMIYCDQGSKPHMEIRVRGNRSWFNKLEWDNPRKSNPDFRGDPHSHSNFKFVEWAKEFRVSTAKTRKNPLEQGNQSNNKLISVHHQAEDITLIGKAAAVVGLSMGWARQKALPEDWYWRWMGSFIPN